MVCLIYPMQYNYDKWNIAWHVQKEPDNVEEPFLYLAEQFYQIYNEKAEEQT